jgi:hypothetical protein
MVLDELAAAAVEVDEAAIDVEMVDRGSVDISCWRRSLSRELMVAMVSVGADDKGDAAEVDEEEEEEEEDERVGVGKAANGFDVGENEEDGGEVVKDCEEGGGNEDEVEG